MKTKMTRWAIRMTMMPAALVAMTLPGVAAVPMGTSITYQGQLKHGGVPLNDTCDFEFTLWNNAIGTLASYKVGPTLTFDGQGGNPPPITVTSGLFTADLDFGVDAFGGFPAVLDQRWLDIKVACPSGSALQSLSPRQPIRPTPYALQTRGLYVDPNRNVGIGTTSPTNRLSLYGNTNLMGFLGVGDATPNAQLSVGNGGKLQVSGFDGDVLFNDDMGTIKFPPTDGSNSPMIEMFTSGFSNGDRMVIAHSQSWPHGLQFEDTTGKFHFINTGGTRFMSIDLIQSNVGIGTSSPQSRLHVIHPDSHAITGECIGEGTSGSLGHEWAGVYGQANLPGGYAGYFVGEGFFEGDLEVDGNVGIGVSSPAARLHLGGTPGVDGLMFPDGTLQTTAAGGGGEDSLWSETGNDIFYTTGDVGVGTTTPAHALQVISDGDRAVSGENHAASGVAHGVYGKSVSTSGRGVSGEATASTGTTYGLSGRSYSTNGRGVFGNASASSGSTHGVSGRSWSSTGRGVYGLASATSGVNYGVYGETDSPDGFAGYFVGPKNYFQGNVGIGLQSPTAKLHIGGTPNVDGIMFPDGTLQTTAAGGGGGLWSPSGSNIYYDSGNVGIGTDLPQTSLHIVGPDSSVAMTAEVGGYGARGVSSRVDGSTAEAVYGKAEGVTGKGVRGDATGTGESIGVYGVAESTSGRGIYGYATANSGSTRGAWGRARSPQGYGVYGNNSASSGDAIGVRGQTSSPDGYAAYFTGGRNYFDGNLGIGESNPTAKLHIGGTAGIDGIKFPDGTVQTSAATGGGGGDGHSLDAVDGDPANAVFVDNNGNVAVGYDLRVDGELIAEEEITLSKDPISGAGLAALNRNTDGHGRLVTYADGLSVSSAVVGTDTDENGAGGLVLLSFDNAVGPAVKLDSVSNAGRATLARSTGLFTISETLTMFADAPDVGSPGAASGGGGIDLLNDNGVRTLTLRGADLGAAASIQGFGPTGGTVFSLKAGTNRPVLKLSDGSGLPTNQIEMAVGSPGCVFAMYNSSGQTTVRIDSEHSSDGAGRVTTEKLLVDGGEVVMKDGANAESVRLYADDPFGTHDGASLYLRDGTATGVALHADYNNSGFSRVVSDVIEIRGGADLSEQFDVSGQGAEVKPGMVVAIDTKRPGKLTIATGAYDKTVAGIISGAGGVKPGMLMGQKGSIADGKHPVALTGRVWTWCDASGSTIEPGDLLTTSNKPGHAMKVTDHASAQGAIIGKAMTALEGGSGLVLVLVSLQ